MRTVTGKPKATQQTMSATSTIPGRTRFEPYREANSMLHLQRTIGNQAVQRLLGATTEDVNGAPTSTDNAHIGLDFSRIPAQAGTPGTIQTSLTVSTPGDRYEQEADRIAAQVMRMPDQQLRSTCACGGECPECRTKRPAQNRQVLQIQRVRAGDVGQIAAPPSVHEAVTAPGHPLDPETRGFMEPRFGYDFSGVRVHTGVQADAASAAVGARAFTAGADVVFRRGEFIPHTQSGRALLAHELTHVVQQSGSNQPASPGELLRQPHLAGRRIQCSPDRPPRAAVPVALLELMPARIRGALGLLERAGAGTFGPWVAPLIRFLSSHLTYRDPNHQNHDGQELEVALRRRGEGPRTTPRIFRLRLVLDDQDNPLERARFEPQGESGSIVLNIRPSRGAAGATGTAGQRIDALSADALADVLHHEAVHMLRHWQMVYGEGYLPFTGLERSALGLTMFTSEIARIERDLQTIFVVVNAARPSRNAVPGASARDFAQRLTEEAMVRGETMYMGMMRGRREQAGAGSVAGGLAQTSGPVERATVETYLFAFGDMLTPQDRTALSAPSDAARLARNALTDIALAFDAIIQQHTELRWSRREFWPAYP